MEDMALKNVWAYSYIPLTILGDGVWGVWIFTIKGVSVYLTKYKKLSYNVYEHILRFTLTCRLAQMLCVKTLHCLHFQME